MLLTLQDKAQRRSNTELDVSQLAAITDIDTEKIDEAVKLLTLEPFLVLEPHQNGKYGIMTSPAVAIMKAKALASGIDEAIFSLSKMSTDKR